LAAVDRRVGGEYLLFGHALYRHVHDVAIGGQQLVADLKRCFKTN
jgi:hypothetical protein